MLAQIVKKLPVMQETWVQSLGREDPLEEEMATHFSTLAWRIPRTEEACRLQSMWSQKVRHNWATNTLSSMIPMYHSPPEVLISRFGWGLWMCISNKSPGDTDTAGQGPYFEITVLGDMAAGSQGIRFWEIFSSVQFSSVAQSCLTLCDPMDPPDSSVDEVLQARIPEWAAISFSRSLGVQFSHSVVSNSLWPHESQHARPPCPSPTPGVHSNSCPSSRWCHPDILSSVVPFSSCPQSLPASESFPMSQLFAWGGQSTGVSALASFLPKNTQDGSPLEWTGWISS